MSRLREAWSFPTGDAVTATPTVVRGTVYAGSWDGWFYAVALRTGRLRWKFRLHPQPAVQPDARREAPHRRLGRRAGHVVGLVPRPAPVAGPTW